MMLNQPTSRRRLAAVSPDGNILANLGIYYTVWWPELIYLRMICQALPILLWDEQVWEGLTSMPVLGQAWPTFRR